MVHNTFNAPKESWPAFLWYVIEFGIVVGIATGTAYQVTPAFHDMVGFQAIECEQESHISKCAAPKEPVRDEGTLNWIFWGITGAIFLVYYLLIRTFILKKPVLSRI